MMTMTKKGKAKMIDAPPRPAELVRLEIGTTRIDEVKGYRPGGVFVIVDVCGKERMVRRIESPKADVCWADYWAV